MVSDPRAILVTFLAVLTLAGAVLVGVSLWGNRDARMPSEVMRLSIESNQAARAEARGDFE